MRKIISDLVGFAEICNETELRLTEGGGRCDDKQGPFPNPNPDPVIPVPQPPITNGPYKPNNRK